MQRKLSRALEGEVRRALDGEAVLERAIVREAEPPQATGALVLARSRLVFVADSGCREWPVAQGIAVAEHPVPTPGQPVAFSVLAGDDVLRFVMPSGVALEQVLGLLLAIERVQTAGAVARVAALPWWEAKALWPLAVKGRLASTTAAVAAGAWGSLGLGRRGVSLYLAEESAPRLQWPWPDVVGLFVAEREELVERLTAARAATLGVLQWGLDTSSGESYVTVVTEDAQLHFAAEAPASKLRSHWESVLERAAAPAPNLVAMAQGVAGDVVSRLERLASLRARGALSEAEFTAAKAAILGGQPSD